jgi:hypothetical protein
MNMGRTIFAQVMDHVPLHEFRRCVEQYRGDYKTQRFSSLDQFLCMAFAQLTYRESLRDIEACLRAQSSKLYHMGIRGAISRSTLAYANEHRDWRLFADFAHVLIQLAKELYVNDTFLTDLNETAYALDSTTIDLCLSLFPWARFRKRKGAIKLHTLLDLRGSIPSFIKITHGKVYDVNILDELLLEPGSFYVMDRGYLDFARLYALHQLLAFFVIRAKTTLRVRRLSSQPIEPATGVLCDQRIVLTGFYASQDYPDTLRRIRYVDAHTHKRVTFLCNNFTLAAPTIAELYRCRWHVELFFKWIKQHLRIKRFYGTSENSVKTQIWIAVSVYVLVTIIKKRLGLEQSLYTILQVLSLTLFEKTPISCMFARAEEQTEISDDSNQLQLFDI